VIGGWPLRLTKGRGVLAVAVDDSGRVAVAGEAENSVQVFTADGTLIAELTGLARPKALAFASDGSLLVAESAPGRIRRLSLQAVARE
jgi:sugar lactone lactonase YvrE